MRGDIARAERVLAIYHFFLNELQVTRPAQVGDEQVAATLASATIIWQGRVPSWASGELERRRQIQGAESRP